MLYHEAKYLKPVISSVDTSLHLGGLNGVPRIRCISQYSCSLKFILLTLSCICLKATGRLHSTTVRVLLFHCALSVHHCRRWCPRAIALLMRAARTSERRQTSTRRHGCTTQKTAIFLFRFTSLTYNPSS